MAAAAINMGTASPAEAEGRNIDLKQASIQVQPVQLDTPATTPEQNSPADEHDFAGKKVFAMNARVDKIRELVGKLSLEEQVRCDFFGCTERART